MKIHKHYIWVHRIFTYPVLDGAVNKYILMQQYIYIICLIILKCYIFKYTVKVQSLHPSLCHISTYYKFYSL